MNQPEIPRPEKWSQLIPWLGAQRARFEKLSQRAGHPDPHIRKIYAGKAETLENVIKIMQSIQKP